MVQANHLPARGTDPATSWLAAEVDPEGRRRRARFWVSRALTVGFPDGATDHEIRVCGLTVKGAPTRCGRIGLLLNVV